MGGIVTAWMELARKMITDGIATEGIQTNQLQNRHSSESRNPQAPWKSLIPAFAGMTDR